MLAHVAVETSGALVVGIAWLPVDARAKGYAHAVRETAEVSDCADEAVLATALGRADVAVAAGETWLVPPTAPNALPTARTSTTNGNFDVDARGIRLTEAADFWAIVLRTNELGRAQPAFADVVGRARRTDRCE